MTTTGHDAGTMRGPSEVTLFIAGSLLTLVGWLAGTHLTNAYDRYIDSTQRMVAVASEIIEAASDVAVKVQGNASEDHSDAIGDFRKTYFGKRSLVGDYRVESCLRRIEAIIATQASGNGLLATKPVWQPSDSIFAAIWLAQSTLRQQEIRRSVGFFSFIRQGAPSASSLLGPKPNGQCDA